MRRLLPLLPLLCAATYDTGDSTPYPHTAFSEKELAKSVSKAAKFAGIKQIILRNEQGDTEVDKLQELDKAALSALMRVQGLEDPEGKEYDLLVPVGQDRIAVTVWWAPPAAVVEVGPALQPASSTREDITGVVLEENGTSWDPRALGIVADALATLTDVERERIEGLRIIRSPGPPKGARSLVKASGRLKAVYIQEESGESSLVLPNYALEESKGTFCGPASAPKEVAERVLLHELAHAVHQGKWRARLAEIQALEAAFNEPEGKTTEAVARHIELVEEHEAEEQAPLVAAWVKRFDSAPTAYGDLSPIEAFAEAFALYHMDPAALRRVMPDAHAWFESDYKP